MRGATRARSSRHFLQRDGGLYGNEVLERIVAYRCTDERCALHHGPRSCWSRTEGAGLSGPFSQCFAFGFGLIVYAN